MRAESHLLRFLLIFQVFMLSTSLWYRKSFGTERDRGHFFKAKNCERSCTLRNGNLTTDTIEQFPTKSITVCFDIIIGYKNNLTEKKVEEAFKNMKHLIGTLEVSSTTFVRGKFLAGLESIETDQGTLSIVANWDMKELDLSNLTSINCTEVEIISNSRMQTLKIPNLKKVTQKSLYSEPRPVEVTIDGLASNFCITFDQMEHFLSIDGADFSRIFANYCTPTAEDKVCTEIQEGCTRFFGDLRINANFSDFEHLKTIEAIFGRLIVILTELENLDCLANLRYVAPLGWGYFDAYKGDSRSWAVGFNNSKLVDYYLPNLKRVRSDSRLQAWVHNNNEVLRNNSRSCRKLEDALHGYQHVIIDQTSCSNIEWIEKQHYEERKKYIILNAIGVGALVLLILFGIALNYCKAKKEENYTVSYSK